MGGSRGRTRSWCTAHIGGALGGSAQAHTYVQDTKLGLKPRGMRRGAALRRRLDVGGGDWVVQMGDSNDEREVLRLGNEHPGRKVKPRGGQTAQGRDRTHAGVRAGLGNALILALARPCLLCKALPWPHFLQNLLRPSN